MKTEIFKTLASLGLTSEKTRVLLSNKTRDQDNLNVWRDKVSGVIYIDDYYVGDSEYVTGLYRQDKLKKLKIDPPNYEAIIDVRRRVDQNLPMIAGKKVLDFGCGSGEFLESIQQYCQEVVGIEIDEKRQFDLSRKKIEFHKSIEDIKNKSIDVITSFHVIEHLPKPVDVLKKLKTKLSNKGLIIIEIPHANDLLLSKLGCTSYKSFTLWSQHLILHTRESITLFLQEAGFNDVLVKNIQRYPVSNHLSWLNQGKPGGHKSELSSIDTISLRDAYEAALASVNSTDTLVAVARAKQE